MKTHDEMVTEWQKDPAFRNAYEALAEEFALFDALFQARTKAGLTQAEVAERMGTKTPAVARLEAGGGSKKHSPSIATLQKYATAVGCRLEIQLIPLSQSQQGGQEGHARSKQVGQRKSRPALRRRGNPSPNQGLLRNLPPTQGYTGDAG